MRSTAKKAAPPPAQHRAGPRPRLDESLPPFPRAHVIAGVLFIRRDEFENYKRLLCGEPLLPVVVGEPIKFITVKQAGSELGLGEHSVKRRIYISRRLAAAEEAAAKQAEPAAAPMKRQRSFETA